MSESRRILEETITISDTTLTEVNQIIEKWFSDNQFIEITQIDISTISAKQRIHDGGEGLHWRNRYKDVIVSIIESENNVEISLKMYYPKTMRYNNKEKEKLVLFWAEYVSDLYTHLGVEMPEKTRLRLFPYRYYEEVKKDRVKLFVASSVLTIILIVELVDKASFYSKLVLIGFFEIMLYQLILRKKL